MNASPARCSSATWSSAGDLGGVRDTVPQLEGALEQRGGLAERVDRLGRGGGADTRPQRVALVARGGVVVGDAGGDLRAVGPSPARRSSAAANAR